MEGLDAHQWGLVEGFFPRVAKRVMHHVGEPAAKGSHRGKGMGHGKGEEAFSMNPECPQANEDLLGSCSPPKPVDAAGSAAAAALLGLALVFLRWGFVVAQPLEVCKDPGLRDLSLEPAQGGFNPFVFADGDLGHKRGRRPQTAN